MRTKSTGSIDWAERDCGGDGNLRPGTVPKPGKLFRLVGSDISRRQDGLVAETKPADARSRGALLTNPAPTPSPLITSIATSLKRRIRDRCLSWWSVGGLKAEPGPVRQRRAATEGRERVTFLILFLNKTAEGDRRQSGIENSQHRSSQQRAEVENKADKAWLSTKDANADFAALNAPFRSSQGLRRIAAEEAWGEAQSRWLDSAAPHFSGEAKRSAREISSGHL